MGNKDRLRRLNLNLPSRENVAIPVDVGLNVSSHSLAQWVAYKFNHNLDDYDKAIDYVYNHAGVGGSKFHHLLDGQHDFLGALHAVHDLHGDDSFLRELVEASEHLLRDTTSISGINPFFSISPKQFDTIAGFCKELGISKTFLADALTVNGPELLGGAIGLAATIIVAQKNDPSRVSTLAGAYITSAAASANPVLLPVAAGGLVYSFYKAEDKKEVIVKAGKGSVVSGSSILVSGLVGGPVWLGCIVGIGTAVSVRYAIDNPDRTFKRFQQIIRPASSILRKAVLSYT